MTSTRGVSGNQNTLNLAAKLQNLFLLIEASQNNQETTLPDNEKGKIVQEGAGGWTFEEENLPEGGLFTI